MRRALSSTARRIALSFPTSLSVMGSAFHSEGEEEGEEEGWEEKGKVREQEEGRAPCIVCTPLKPLAENTPTPKPNQKSETSDESALTLNMDTPRFRIEGEMETYPNSCGN